MRFDGDLKAHSPIIRVSVQGSTSHLHSRSFGDDGGRSGLPCCLVSEIAPVVPACCEGWVSPALSYAGIPLHRAGIHMKTDPRPGTTHGYPDPGYFQRVLGELAAVGVSDLVEQ